MMRTSTILSLLLAFSLGMCFFVPVVSAGDVTIPFGIKSENLKHLPSVGTTEVEVTVDGKTKTLTQGKIAGQGGGEIGGFREILNLIRSFITLLIGSVATLMLFVAGWQLVTAQSAMSEQIEKQKLNVVYILTGLIVFALASDVVFNYIFFEAPVEVDGKISQVAGGYVLDPLGVQAAILGSAVALRIKDLITLFLSFSGAGAILVLVIAGLRMVINPGSDEEIEKQKKLIGYTAVGIIIIGLADTIINKIIFVDAGYKPVDVDQFEIQLQGLSNYVLGFLGVVVFVSFVISGFVLIANFGNEEITTKVKSTLKNVIIGVLLSFSAYTIVATLLNTFMGG